MENTMIERVARVLCKRALATTSLQMDEVGGQARWTLERPVELALFVDNNWARHAATAADAIEAMLDRTEPMLDAGTAVLWPYVQTLQPGSVSVAVWKAMVKAALDKPTVDA